MRDHLEGLYLQRVSVKALFSRFGRTDEGRNVACFEDLLINGEVYVDHVWTHRSKVMKLAELNAGDMVSFEAQVGRYARVSDAERVQGITPYDYNLERIRDFQVIKRVKWRGL